MFFRESFIFTSVDNEKFLKTYMRTHQIFYCNIRFKHSIGFELLRHLICVNLIWLRISILQLCIGLFVFLK